MVRPLTAAAGAATVLLGAAGAIAFGGGDPACAAVEPRIACPGSTTATTAAPAPRATGDRCTVTRLLRTATVRPSGRGLRISFTRRVDRPVTVSVFQSATTRRVLGERLVFRATRSSSPVRWSGRSGRRRTAVGDGVFFVRLSLAAPGRRDTRRIAVRRTGGRFRLQRAFARTDGCGTVRAFKLERPAFGGRTNRAVGVSFRLASQARAIVELRRGGRTVRQLSSAVRRGGTLHRVRLDAERLPRGLYEVRLRVGTTTTSLFVQRI